MPCPTTPHPRRPIRIARATGADIPHGSGLRKVLRGAWIVSSGAWQLVFWTLTFAAWLFVHVLALVRVLGSKEIPERAKWGSLLPPVTPFVAWQYGIRGPA